MSGPEKRRPVHKVYGDVALIPLFSPLWKKKYPWSFRRPKVRSSGFSGFSGGGDRGVAGYITVASGPKHRLVVVIVVVAQSRLLTTGRRGEIDRRGKT